jgi:hypothetical protein
LAPAVWRGRDIRSPTEFRHFEVLLLPDKSLLTSFPLISHSTPSVDPVELLLSSMTGAIEISGASLFAFSCAFNLPLDSLRSPPLRGTQVERN